MAVTSSWFFQPDAPLAVLHRLPAGFGDLGGIVFLGLTDFRVHHVGALEESRVGRAGLRAGDAHLGIPKLCQIFSDINYQ